MADFSILRFALLGCALWTLAGCSAQPQRDADDHSNSPAVDPSDRKIVQALSIGNAAVLDSETATDPGARARICADGIALLLERTDSGMLFDADQRKLLRQVQARYEKEAQAAEIGVAAALDPSAAPGNNDEPGLSDNQKIQRAIACLKRFAPVS